MGIRIPMRNGLIAALALALAGCVGTGLGGGGTHALAVAGGAVTVTGPQGYCVDRSASRDSASGAFVLLGSCASLTGSRAAGQPQRPAILTASVGPPSAEGTDVAAALPALAEFFQSTAGRAALSRTGEAGSVAVDRVSISDGVLYLHLSDRALASGQAVEAGYWRALTAIRGRIVTLAVLSPVSGPLGAAEQRAALDQFVARMRAANPAAVAVAAQG